MGLEIDEKTDAVLNAFKRYGTATTGFLVDETGLTRPTLSKRLSLLQAVDAIEYVHEPTAWWKLNEDPRDFDGEQDD